MEPAESLEHNTFALTQAFNEYILNETDKVLDMSEFDILKDDIKNYRKLSKSQLSYIKTLSETEKIEIIELYDQVIVSIFELLDV